MILTCPACQKKYLIPDSAIGIEGRQVRCAACRHSWFEDAPDGLVSAAPAEHIPARPEPRPQAPSPPAPVSAEPAAPNPDTSQVPFTAPLSGPVDAQTTPTPDPAKDMPPSWTSPDVPTDSGAPSESAAEAEADDEYDPYAHAPPFRARRNTSRRWTIAAAIVSLLLFAGLGAIYYFATPNFLAKLGIPIGEIDTPLITQFTSDRGPKEGMPATAPFVIIHGQIINPTDQPQRVPDIIAELLDSHGRVVYSWTVTPSRRTIGRKATLPIDDTAVNIPMSARETRLTFSGVDPR